MREVIVSTVSIVLLIAGTFFIWRLLSRHHSLPCPSWLRWMVEIDNPFARSNSADFIISHLDLRPGMTVLDAGCGPGRLTIPLATAVFPQGVVFAVDVQEGMLASVVAKAKAAKIENVKTVCAQIGQGRLGHKAFDRAVMAAVLGEVPNRGAAMDEVFRVLKPGGIFAVAELVFDPHFQSRRVVRDLAVASGFSERAHFGTRLAYLQLFERPSDT